MKMKLFIGIGAVIVIFVGFVCFCAWFLSGASGKYYYSQIDNSKIEQVTSRGGVIDLHGGLEYSYTLSSYDKDGNEKDITFGASRKLREGAFIRLTVMPVRGVTEWSEMQYDELPVAVQKQYVSPK